MGRGRVLLSLALLLATDPLAASGAEILAVDPSASRVRIHLGRAGLLKFMGHDHEIDAPVAEGRIEIVDGAAGRPSVRLRFESGRLTIVPGTEPAGDVPKVEARMRGPEVLDVLRFPEIVFVSSSVEAEPVEPGRYRLRVAGILELKGRAFSIEVRLEARRSGDGLEARGEAALRLRELGIEPPSVAGVVNVADRFRLELEIVARPSGRGDEAPVEAAPGAGQPLNGGLRPGPATSGRGGGDRP